MRIRGILEYYRDILRRYKNGTQNSDTAVCRINLAFILEWDRDADDSCGVCIPDTTGIERGRIFPANLFFFPRSSFPGLCTV